MTCGPIDRLPSMTPRPPLHLVERLFDAAGQEPNARDAPHLAMLIAHSARLVRGIVRDRLVELHAAGKSVRTLPEPGSHRSAELWRSARSTVVQAAASARAVRRITCGGCPKARRKARRMRSRSAKPVCRAMTSIGWRLCSIISRAVSIRRFSTALAGDWPVSARNARLNWRGLKCALRRAV